MICEKHKLVNGLRINQETNQESWFCQQCELELEPSSENDIISVNLEEFINFVKNNGIFPKKIKQ